MTNLSLAVIGPQEWPIVLEQAKILVTTGFLPEAIKTPQQAVAIMMKGRELGIAPMQALGNIAVIKGKPVANAELMLALIFRDHGDKAVEFVETSPQRCTIKYKRRNSSEAHTYSYTMEDAQKAGVLGNQTWQKYPAAMLRARCVSAVAKMAFPDSTMGLYTPEELGATEDQESGEITAGYTETSAPYDHATGEIIDPPHPVAPAPTQQPQPQPQPNVAMRVLATPEQISQLVRLGAEVGYDEDALRAQIGVDDLGRLTAEYATRTIARLRERIADQRSQKAAAQQAEGEPQVVIPELNNAPYQIDDPAPPYDAPDELDEALDLPPVHQHPTTTPIHQPVTNAQYLATEKQIKMIKSTGWYEKKWKDEQIEDFIMETFGCEMAQLSKGEASKAIEMLKGAAATA